MSQDGRIEILAQNEGTQMRITSSIRTERSIRWEKLLTTTNYPGSPLWTGVQGQCSSHSQLWTLKSPGIVIQLLGFVTSEHPLLEDNKPHVLRNLKQSKWRRMEKLVNRISVAGQSANVGGKNEFSLNLCMHSNNMRTCHLIAYCHVYPDAVTGVSLVQWSNWNEIRYQTLG